MVMTNLSKVSDDIEAVLRELVAGKGIGKGHIVVIGTSTSEVLGKHIGTAGAEEIASQLYQGIAIVQQEHGFDLAFQCCEHLNRALVVERALLERLSLTEVSAIPVARAGGSMAAHVYKQLKEPCLVESIQAHAGIDIGDTFIGMHLRPVAVPMRPTIRSIGHAHVTAAFTRPKLIGGTRAVYERNPEINTNDSVHCE